MDPEIQALLVRPRQRRMSELLLWYTAAFIFSARFWLDLRYLNPGIGVSNVDLSDILQNRYLDLLVGVLVGFFPLLFYQVMGKFPFEFVRWRRASHERIDPKEGDHSLVVREKGLDIENSTHQVDAIQLARVLADSSRELAEKIFARSGIYLIVGVLVAFSGLAFFYAQTPQKEMKWDSLLLALAPRFGILFFIELVAFFFLRQYRAAMDEFRYFESIKRKREENMLMLALSKPSGSGVNLLQLLEMWDLSSTPRHLSTGETTEVLETRKLTKDEISLFEKMLDSISAVRAKSK